MVPATNKSRSFQPVEVVAELLLQNGYKNLYAFALTQTRIND